MNNNYLFGLEKGVKALNLGNMNCPYVRYLDCTDYGVYIEKVASLLPSRHAATDVLIDILNEVDRTKVSRYICNASGRTAVLDALPAGLILLPDQGDYIEISPTRLRVFKSGEEVFDVALKESSARVDSIVNPKVTGTSLIYFYALNTCIRNGIVTDNIEMIDGASCSLDAVNTQATLLNYIRDALGNNDEDFFVGALFEEKESPYYYGHIIGWLEEADGRPVFAVTQDLWNINLHLVNSNKCVVCPGVASRKFDAANAHDRAFINTITYSMVHFLGYAHLPDNLIFRASSKWEWNQANDTVWTPDVHEEDDSIEEKFGVRIG